MDITSLDNQYVKKVASLHKKKYRDEYGEFLIEGLKMIKEALEYKINIKNIFYCPQMVEYNLDFPAIKVTEDIIVKMTNTLTPQGIVAVCEIPEYKIKNKDKLVYLDRVQDPGNVGTIIRTADAFGFDGVLLSKGCADIYAPKVVRATMGSLFHIPIKQEIDSEHLKILNSTIYSSSLDTDKYLDNTEIVAPFILVIGNEGQGISNEVKLITHKFVKINMEGCAESLNASIAAGILMYEFSKRCPKIKEEN